MKLVKCFFFFMLLSVFLALTVHNAKHTFFREDNQSNLSIKLCATNFRTRAKRKQKIVHCYGQFNIDCDNRCSRFKGSEVS